MDDWAEYTNPLGVLRDFGLSCLGAGEQADATAGFESRHLDSHALVIITSGSGSYRDRRTGAAGIAVHAPAILSITPGTEHGYAPDAAGWSESWLLVTGSGVQPYTRLGLFDRTRPVLPLRELPALGTEFAELRAALGAADPIAPFAASALCHRILVAVAASIRPADPTAAAARATAAFVESATLEISMDERARRLGLGIAELREAVRTVTGSTPIELLVQSRIRMARQLLVDTELPVSRIAELVGYADAAYFSRLFARRTGVSPSRHRAQFTRGRTTA
ncbi:AraC-like DNA-binding protein [Microterricola gilva]|uniref:AraC-like DNA-binding protein n=1 Tax=Microterricola gilva TaxID=393267 RepID=A0A4Q8AIK4_9MICO|nr:AraC family transcriptional regulator [Microterricola gilva]RZU64277.1 AraC-like DNA-binding protein [Microterricola gilva]